MASACDIEVFIYEKYAGIQGAYIVNKIQDFISSKTSLPCNKKITDALPIEVEYIRICTMDENKLIYFSKESLSKVSYHITVLEDTAAIEEIMYNNDGTEESNASNNWILPCRALDGLWETLFIATGIKVRLMNFAVNSLLMGRRGVDPNIVPCNRLILLHGPPGTGKTTICRAIAQKLSIRLCDHYTQTQLVEVNCHSLFSKWFSESGKLVYKLFSTIRQYAQDEKMLVVVLIDEVESLTSARQQALVSSEPSDAIRVVNAVLTQLDKLRYHPNVLVLATSNLTEAIDAAFTDRADIIQHIGPPKFPEILLILASCFEELKRVGICDSGTIVDSDIEILAEQCEGLSGRTIRKLPVLALADFIEQRDRDAFVQLMIRTVELLREDRDLFNSK